VVGVAAKLRVHQEPGQSVGVLARELQALEGPGQAAPQVIDPHQRRAFAPAVGHQTSRQGIALRRSYPHTPLPIRDSARLGRIGETPGENSGLLARIGFVAQDTPLYRDFTGAELLRLGGKLNRRFDEPMARERLERLGLPLDRRTGRLSSP
jgi:hypothetical protein